MKPLIIIFAFAELTFSGCRWNSDSAKRNGAVDSFPTGDTPAEDTTGAHSAKTGALPTVVLDAGGAGASPDRGADHGTSMSDAAHP